MTEPDPDFERDIDAFWSVIRHASEWICFAFACIALVLIAILLVNWGLGVGFAHAYGSCQTTCWTDWTTGMTYCNEYCWGAPRP